MHPAWSSLYSLALFVGVLTPVSATTSSPQLPDPGEHWQVEPSSDETQLQTALLRGNSRHDTKTGEALLAISCYPGSPMNMSLSIPTRRLGFNADDYEGPSATTDGPLRLITGKRAPISFPVNGWGSVRSLQGDSWVFELGMSINKPELIYWLTDSAHGQLVTLTLPPRESNAPLIAEFVLPEDDSGLRKVTGPCL